MKKIVILSYLMFVVSIISYGQQMSTIESLRTIEKRVSKVVKELSGSIEVSGYQQKSTIQILAKVIKERQVIEQGPKGATQKTEALENLAKKEEYSLRGILNDEQYDMLVAIMEDQ